MTRRIGPVRRNPALDEYEGEWVAVKNGKVVAHAPRSTDLVPLVRALPAELRDGAVVEYVQPPSNAWQAW